jgi:hypothetical protein
MKTIARKTWVPMALTMADYLMAAAHSQDLNAAGPSLDRRGWMPAAFQPLIPNPMAPMNFGGHPVHGRGVC